MSRNSEYFPSSKFLVHLEMAEVEEVKHSIWCIWHLSGVSCCACATMTHFCKNGLGWESTFQPQPELWSTSREPCRIFSSLTWEKAVNNSPSDLGDTGLLKSFKNPACTLDKSLYPVSAVQASPGCQRIAWVAAPLMLVGHLWGPHFSPHPSFPVASTLMLPQGTFIQGNPELDPGAAQIFLHCITELG